MITVRDPGDRPRPGAVGRRDRRALRRVAVKQLDRRLGLGRTGERRRTGCVPAVARGAADRRRARRGRATGDELEANPLATARTARERLRATRRAQDHESVTTAPAIDPEPGTSGRPELDSIITGPSPDVVLTIGFDDVRPGASVNAIGAATPIEDVIPSAAAENVSSWSADQAVGMRAPREQTRRRAWCTREPDNGNNSKSGTNKRTPRRSPRHQYTLSLSGLPHPFGSDRLV